VFAFTKDLRLEAKMKNAAIRIEGLLKDFSVGIQGKKLRALNGLNLEIEANQIYGLLGPNGSGKSTTIKLLLGLLRPTEGSSSIFGAPSGSMAARQKVGYLPEAPYLYRFLTGYELVNYYARVCGMPRLKRLDRVAEVIDLVGMDGAAGQRVGTYSKGMLQRIGLAQALVHDPQLVILDEPTAGVDPIGTVAIATIVQQLKARGKTILISSHLLPQMEGLCDRVAILHQGQLLCEGAVSELLKDPGKKSLLVNGLDAAGEVAVAECIKAQGAELERVEDAASRLETLFGEALARTEGKKSNTSGGAK
jgi:ABC-2 type transport system ATP-binding protein